MKLIKVSKERIKNAIEDWLENATEEELRAESTYARSQVGSDEIRKPYKVEEQTLTSYFLYHNKTSSEYEYVEGSFDIIKEQVEASILAA